MKVTEMFDWRKRNSNPTDKASVLEMDQFLRSITQLDECARPQLILDFCANREVLDIGAGEHDPSFYSSQGWEHGQICKVAKRTVAIELNAELCDHYRHKGFDFRCLDATSDADLGERFDRVFLGDVIEHVDNPVALMRFAKRHLKRDGAILVTTPNPFAPRFRRTRRKFGTRYVVANLEHTCWISPSNMHEIAWRAGLEFRALHWPLQKKPNSELMSKSIQWLRRMSLKIWAPESIFVEYVYELKLGKTDS